jgi:site-specific recombinase XerD
VALHTLRHTCATNLLRAGVGLKHVADLIGDTAKTVDETYAHLDSDDLTRGLQAGMRHVDADARASHLRLVG